MSNLPKFKNPPVIETVLGIQFDPLPNFSNAHLGAFWQSIGVEEWPAINDAPAIAPQFERFGEESRVPVGGFMLKLTPDLNSRLQIHNSDNTRMIQVQNERLHYNWVGYSGHPYPNFNNVKPEFDKIWKAFREFIIKRKLGDLRLNQWEVTYVNHIPRGSLWNEPRDWVEIFPTLTPLPSQTSRVELESLIGEWHYTIKQRLGRLHINIAHGMQQKPTEREIIVLNLTARGPLPSNDGTVATYEDGFRVGHESIVISFKELTSEKAHNFWGLDP